MLLNQPLLIFLCSTLNVLKFDCNRSSLQTLGLFVGQLLQGHELVRLVGMNQVPEISLHVNLANGLGFSRRSVRTQCEVCLGFEVRHGRNVVSSEICRFLTIRRLISKTVGEDLRKTKSGRAVLVIIPLMKLI